MKYLILFISLLSFSASAQKQDFSFSKRLLDCEDKWVILPINKDSLHVFGFIYLDNMAGLTFNLGGSFKYKNTGEIEVKKQPITANINERISPSKLLVSEMPKNMFKQIGIEEVPSWLSVYKREPNNIHRLFRLGFTYNLWNEFDKALTYLDQVKKIDPNYNGLSYEYAFSFNASKQYEKALEIAKEALIKQPTNCDLQKELIYSLMNLKKTDEAIKSGKEAYKICTDENYKKQLLQSIVLHSYNTKNKDEFNTWAVEAKKVFSKDLKAMEAITKWELELNN